MKESRSLRNTVSSWATKVAFFSLFLLLGAAALASAQNGAMSPNQDEADGVSAGGKWLEFASTDKMTGPTKCASSCSSDNYFKEDPDYKPRVSLICTNGKLTLADFNPGVRLPPPIAPAGGDSRSCGVESSRR